MTTPEGKVKDRVKKVLKAEGAYYHMPVQNGLGAPTLDFVGCHLGRFFAIETKPGNKQPTPLQELTMEDMRKAGGRVFLINDETGTTELESWLR